MPQPQNRFQIKLDSTIKTDPENWINFTPTTERHEIYRTLLTTFSEGTVKLIKTAKNYVDTAYAQYGAAQTISVEWLEYDYATDAYETIFSLGRLNLSEKYKRSRDSTEVGFEPTDFIMNVLNRDEIKTDLQSLLDMDGDAITTFTDETHTVTLSDQVIDFSAKYEEGSGITDLSQFTVTTDYTLYVPIPLFFKEVINEGMVAVLDVSTGYETTKPIEPQMYFNDSGDVEITWTDFSFDIEYFRSGGYTLNGISTVTIVYTKNGGAEIVLDTDTLPATGTTENGTLTVSSLSLSGISSGDGLLFYIKIVDLDGSFPPKITITSSDAKTKLLQSTTYEDTDCEFMLPWEVFLRLCQKITGNNNCLRSTLFGRTDGEVKTYVADGDAAFYAITTPKLLRGFPLATNPINADLMSVFKGYDKMLLLGLGVVYESGVPYIVIERLEHFMDDSSSATTFVAAYPGIDWEAAISYMWGNVKGGYSKYKLERNPILGSPHTPRNYAIPYLSEHISNQYDNTCNFVTSGHLIELLRRNRYDESNQKDLPFDEDLVCLHLERDGGGSFDRVVDDDFSAVSNIDNPTTNSNLHLTPARNLLRQAPLLLAGLAKRIIDTPAFTGLARYQSGDGNTAAETTVTGDTLVPEDGDLTRAMAAEVYSNAPLFDASEMGSCIVTVTKAQRQIIKEGLLTEITVIDNGTSYTGFIESFKDVNLEKGVAKLKFLSNTNI